MYTSSLTRRLFSRRKSVPQTGSSDEDEDVLAERQRVDNGAAGSDLLQVSQLTKVYQHLNRKVQAVKKLSFGIPAGEVSSMNPTPFEYFGLNNFYDYELWVIDLILVIIGLMNNQA